MPKKPNVDVSPLSIDKFALDRECVELPEEYGRWGELLAKAKLRVARAKAELELCEAELGLAIRSNPGKFGFASKPSEATVAAKILTMPEYQLFQSESHEARHEQDQYEVVTRGLDHKKTMLEQLCFLHNASYFSKPRTAEPDRPKMRKRGRDE